MNCLEFRRRAGAEPSIREAPYAAHRAECASCAAFQDEMRAMDAVLARAMRIPLQPAAARQDRPRATPARRRLAIAASLVAGALVAATLWVSYPAPTLAGEVMDHVAHEPQAWNAGDALDGHAIEDVLSPSGVRLRADAGAVTYARRCLFARHRVPHLVVQTAAGPVTVLLLLHRTVEARLAIQAGEFTGVVLPAPRGSIAIVGRGVPALDDVARQVFEAVDWDA